MEAIIIDSKKVNLTFRRSKRARRLRMQMNNEGKLTLVAPWYSTKKSVDRFVAQNIKWIEKQSAKIETQKKLRPKFRYQTGDTYYYFGEPVILSVNPSDRKLPTIKVRDDKMVITLHKKISKADGVVAVRNTIEKFYRKKAEEVVHDRLQFFNEYYGFSYNRVTMRNQKTRWGSCSHSGNLNFNWRLIMAPIEVIDYVVVHELCHIGQMNHSPKFWSLVSQTTPDYKEVRKWLSNYHYLLTY